MIFWVLILATYSGNLMAALTVVTSTIPFTTTQDLADQSAYEVASMSGTAMETSLMVIRTYDIYVYDIRLIKNGPHSRSIYEAKNFHI